MNTLFAYYEREEYMNTNGALIAFAHNLQRKCF